MEQIKLFNTGSASILEQHVNVWLSENRSNTIKSINYSMLSNNYSVIIVYITSKKL